MNLDNNFFKDEQVDHFHKVPVVSYEDIQCESHQLSQTIELTRDKMNNSGSLYHDTANDIVPWT